MYSAFTSLKRLSRALFPRFEATIQPMPLLRGCIELDLILELRSSWILQKMIFSSSQNASGFCKPLVSGDVVVAAPEREEQCIGRRRLELVKLGTLYLVFGARPFLLGMSGISSKATSPVRIDPSIAELLHAIGPHPVRNVRTSRHVALKLSNALFPVRGFNLF